MVSGEVVPSNNPCIEASLPLYQVTSENGTEGRYQKVKTSYLSALSFVNSKNIPLPGENIRHCHSGELYAHFRCKDCGKTIDAPIGGCQDALCPECRKYYAKRKATEGTQRLKAVSAGYFQGKEYGWPHVEFTVPESKYSLFLDSENLNRWYRVVWSTLVEWYGCDIAGVEVYHPNASKEFWRFKPHIPVTLAGIAHSKEKGWFPVRLYRHAWEIRTLRAIYTRRMCKTFGIVREEIHTRDHLLDVNYGYCKTVNELGKRMQYELRYPSPAPNVQGWQALEGLSNIEILGVASQFLMLKGFRRIRWVGFLSTRKGKWLKANLGIELRVWTDSLDWNKCPYCGGFLKFEGFINNLVRPPPYIGLN